MRTEKFKRLLVKLETLPLPEALGFMYVEELHTVRFNSDFGIVTIKIKAPWCKNAKPCNFDKQ